MNINSETKRSIVTCNIDFTEEDHANLLEYAENNMPESYMTERMLEWALVDILRNELEDS